MSQGLIPTGWSLNIPLQELSPIAQLNSETVLDKVPPAFTLGGAEKPDGTKTAPRGYPLL